jgi:hypothetical protein
VWQDNVVRTVEFLSGVIKAKWKVVESKVSGEAGHELAMASAA